MNKNDILIIHGTAYKDMAKRVLEAAGVAAEIGGKDSYIGLKPNYVTDSLPEDGATTHTEILEGVLEYLTENGFHNIAIMEGSWVGSRTGDAFRRLGVGALCKRFGVPFIDLQKDTYREYSAKGMKIAICDEAMKTDYMINLPVLKGHCQTCITCALKNNKGVMPNKEKRRFHAMGLHRPIAHLNTVAKNDFILVDNICGDLDFEEGGNPVVMNRLLGFKDPVLCDTFVCDSMGYDVDDVPYIRLAEELGVGSTDLAAANVIHINEPEDAGDARAQTPSTRKVRALTRFIDERDACSACYGSLIHALNRLSDTGRLNSSMPVIAIGQGHRGLTGEIGVGRCTSLYRCSLKGCPPKASDIMEFLELSVDE